MRKLNEIPKLQEAMRYLNTRKPDEPAVNIVESLRAQFGYSNSLAYDVVTLWVEALNSKNPITFLSE